MTISFQVNTSVEREPARVCVYQRDRDNELQQTLFRDTIYVNALIWNIAFEVIPEELMIGNYSQIRTNQMWKIEQQLWELGAERRDDLCMTDAKVQDGTKEISGTTAQPYLLPVLTNAIRRFWQEKLVLSQAGADAVAA
jgi:tRNA G37 N-methylase TrmD